MKQFVVTGWGIKDEDLYGKRMATTFDKYWPKEVGLISYVEKIPKEKLPRVEYRLLQEIEGWNEFVNKWHDIPEMCGLPGERRSGKGKIGYDYRWDALKWARQAFIPLHAASDAGQAVMTWFDGDTYTHDPVPDNFLENLLENYNVAYLGRGKMHPEIGYVGYRLPEALPLLEKWHEYYSTGTFETHAEWHSAWLWRDALIETKVDSIDLTEGKDYDRKCNIWHQSDLDKYTKHLKGTAKKRKINV